MKKMIISLLSLASITCLADDSLIKFRHDNPDVVFQMRLNEANRNHLVNLTRQTILENQKIDIFNNTIDYSQPIDLGNQLSLEEFLDKKVAKIIRDSLNFSFKQISSSVDIYNLSYQTGQPVFTLNSSTQTEDTIDLDLSFSFRKLDISVEKLYINNHSPGVKISRDATNPKELRVEGKESMTLIDDIYIKIKSPTASPLVSIETNNDEPSIISGKIHLKVKKNSDQSLSLEYVDHNFEIFDSKDADVIADKIKVTLGEGSRIAGLDAIEIGRSEIKMKSNLGDLINKKKAFLANLVAEPIIYQVENSEITQKIRKKVDGVKVAGTILRPLGKLEKTQNIVMATMLNTVGILDNHDQELQQFQLSTNNSIYWLNNLFQESDILPFPLVKTENYQKSLSNIKEEIQKGEADIILSLGQDYINHLIYNVTKGQLDLPNDPSTKKDDIIHNGKKGVFLILEDPSATQGKIAIDIMIQPKFFQKIGLAIATFKTKLYFPLIISPKISTELINGIPHLVIQVNDIDMTEETLRQGLYGIATNLNKGISRKLVIKQIKKQLSPFIGSKIKSIPLQSLAGLNPGAITNLESDKMGRLNLKISLNQDNPEAGKFLRAIPGLLKKITQ
jgi:hypothetical protein